MVFFLGAGRYGTCIVHCCPCRICTALACTVLESTWEWDLPVRHAIDGRDSQPRGAVFAMALNVIAQRHDGANSGATLAAIRRGFAGP